MKAATMADEHRPRLGRGLAALIGDAGEENAAVARSRGQKKIARAFLGPKPRKPRQDFNDAELVDLGLL